MDLAYNELLEKYNNAVKMCELFADLLKGGYEHLANRNKPNCTSTRVRYIPLTEAESERMFTKLEDYKMALYLLKQVKGS